MASSHLRADCLYTGSAPGPTLGNKYGRTLPFLITPHTSGFVDDVMFSYNGPNRPKSKRTRMFRPVRQVAGTGDEVCRLQLHLALHLFYITRAYQDEVSCSSRRRRKNWPEITELKERCEKFVDEHRQKSTSRPTYFKLLHFTLRGWTNSDTNDTVAAARAY